MGWDGCGGGVREEARRGGGGPNALVFVLASDDSSPKTTQQFLQCIGTGSELKLRFGEGYTLNVSVDRKRGGDLAAVHQFIEESFPEDEVRDGEERVPVKKRCNDIFGTQLKYILNRDKVTLWKVFDAFENNKERLKITDWAITETTLEEVFLKLSQSYVQGGFAEFKVGLDSYAACCSSARRALLLLCVLCSALLFSPSPTPTVPLPRQKMLKETGKSLAHFVRNVDPNEATSAGK